MPATLRYMPDREQLALVEEIETAVATLLPVARLHGGEQGESDDTWGALRELGLLAAGLSEDRGGSGLSAVEQALIAVVLGRALATPAVLTTVAALAHAPARKEFTRIAAGLRQGGELVWVDEPGGDLLLVADDNGFALHAMPSDAREIDRTNWGVRLLAGSHREALVTLDRAGSLGVRLLYAGALAGIAAATLDMAVAYAKIREQFGRPIGSFQAVKHHCANMAIAALSARDVVRFAAVAVADGREDKDHKVESAFFTASSAAIGNAGLNIQVHGGIGFSAEADPHLFLKRAQLLVALGGGLEAAVERVALTGGGTRMTT